MSQRPWLTAAVRLQLGLNGGGCRVSSGGGGGGGALLLFGTTKMGDWGGNVDMAALSERGRSRHPRCLQPKKENGGEGGGQIPQSHISRSHQRHMGRKKRRRSSAQTP